MLTQVPHSDVSDLVYTICSGLSVGILRVNMIVCEFTNLGPVVKNFTKLLANVMIKLLS